jgi:hypothetical protein
MEYFELALRWIFGLQIAFWGLNGFFHWVKIPPSSEVIEKFTQACIETRFLTSPRHCAWPFWLLSCL